ncbi:MAG: type II toxin-antitoxin system VapC family toxin [Dehalococcoidia bacterium]|nr:type II toxin-antitoxin system VapC family toxin [Dehalococcoidia bacterium]
MTSPIFLDANIPTYAAGRPHRLKQPCVQVLRLIGETPASFLTDAEVLQELLHRYLALRRWPEGRTVFDEFARLMHQRVEPIYDLDVALAARLADRYEGLGARDLLHAAVMSRLGIRRIVSADRDFDALPDIERLDPANVGDWQDAALT